MDDLILHSSDLSSRQVFDWFISIPVMSWHYDAAFLLASLDIQSSQDAVPLWSSSFSVGLPPYPSALFYIFLMHPAAGWCTKVCQSLWLWGVVSRPLPGRRCYVWRIASEMCLQALGLCKPVSQVSTYINTNSLTQSSAHKLRTPAH